MPSPTDNIYSRTSFPVSDMVLYEVPSDDIELSSSERTSSPRSNASRKSWQEFSPCEQMLLLSIAFIVTNLFILICTLVGMRRMNAGDPSPTAIGVSIPTWTVESPDFRDPDFRKELCTVVGVDPEPGTPQFLALEWMASEDLEMWDYETISAERLKQRYALAVFHIATGRWNKRGLWASPSGAREHECFWPGVSCDRDKLNVLSLELDLFVGTLQGSIPSDIILLSSLERLSLVNNMLTGDVPESIYSLSNLYSLQLSNSTLSATLSPSIGNLSQLLTLDVTGGGFVGTVPTELGLLRLRRLYMARNELVGTIPSQLGDLSRLEEFFVQDTDLTGQVPTEMCALRALRLEDFRVDCNESVICEAPQCCTVCY